MNSGMPSYRRPNSIDRALNRAFGFLIGLGFGLSHNYLLDVRGRRTGRIFSAPVNVLEFGGARFLVAGRGRTQWVRNAEAAGEAILRKGRTREHVRLRPIPDGDKPDILKAYLDRFKLTVQRYFPVRAGAPPEAFVDMAARYPVFEVLPPGSSAEGDS